MSECGQNQSENIIPFAPTPKQSHPNRSGELDDVARIIVGLLQQAADVAKENRSRSLSVAHGLSLQLRAAEDRIKELEEELRHFQDRALRAENWLQCISREIENRFFEPKETSHSRPNTR